MATVITDAATAREKMIHFLESVKEERLLGLYTFLAEEIEEEIGQDNWEYPEELKAQLDKVDDDIKNDRTENFIGEEELQNRITKLLKK